MEREARRRLPSVLSRRNRRPSGGCRVKQGRTEKWIGWSRVYDSCGTPTDEVYEGESGGTPTDEVYGGDEATAAGWTGDEVNIIWLYPNEQTVQDLGTYEISANVDKISTPLQNWYLYLGTTGIGLVYTADQEIQGWEPTEIIGFKFTDLSNRPIKNVQVDDKSTIEVFPQAITHGDNFIQINLFYTYVPAHGLLDIDIRFA